MIATWTLSWAVFQFVAPILFPVLMIMVIRRLECPRSRPAVPDDWEYRDPGEDADTVVRPPWGMP